MSRILALMLLVAFVAVPVTPIRAQEAEGSATEAAPAEEAAPPAEEGDSGVPVESLPPVVETIEAEDLVPTEPPVEAAPPSETLPGDSLVETQDPTVLFGDPAATSSAPISMPELPSSPLPVEEQASTTPETTPLEAEDPEIVAEVPLEEDPEIVAEVPTEDIAPEKEFRFSIAAERIATKKTPGWKGGVVKGGKKSGGSEVVTNEPSLSLNAEGLPLVSGTCSLEYYVILLYKNSTDYDTDPGAFIMNKAYPCANGQYSFELKDVPTSIPDGRYYLLVGEQGKTGSWTPATSLVGIDIAR